jgi:Leucine-rich repeat (LRR) protein
MRRALDAIIGGRDISKIEWISLNVLSPWNDREESKNGNKIEGNRTKFEHVDQDGLKLLSSLKSFDFSGHAISNIDELRVLADTIEEIFAAKNKIRKLDGIGRFQALRLLDVSGNAIQHIPPQVSFIGALCIFVLTTETIDRYAGKFALLGYI